MLKEDVSFFEGNASFEKEFYPIRVNGKTSCCLLTNQKIILSYYYKWSKRHQIKRIISYNEIDSISFENYNDKIYLFLGTLVLCFGLVCGTIFVPLLDSVEWPDDMLILPILGMRFIFLVGLIYFPISIFLYFRGYEIIRLKTSTKDFKFRGKKKVLKELFQYSKKYIIKEDG